MVRNGNGMAMEMEMVMPGNGSEWQWQLLAICNSKLNKGFYLLTYFTLTTALPKSGKKHTLALYFY